MSSALDAKPGGPSTVALPIVQRAAPIYGKVSRYRLDDYLQLFDFPSPNLSAEQRFTTTVPLQQLFFANSDFMQQQGELIARKVADEVRTPRRGSRRAYRLIFGRAASNAEIKSRARVP